MKYCKEIDVKNHYDLVVCGGGMSGFSAAIIAARKGIKTAIIERYGCLGGVATSAGVNHFLAGRKYNSRTNKIERKVGGLFDEITDKLIQEGDAIDPDTIDLDFNPYGWYKRLAAGIPFDSEKLKILLDDYCIKHDVDIYYFTNIIDVDIKDDNITGIIAHNKSGLFAINADLFIDATGDADVAFLSGCSTRKGRDEDGLMAPASLIMQVDNVNTEEFVTYQNQNQSPKLIGIINELKEKGIWTFPYEIFIAIKLCQDGVFMINTIRQVGIDGVDGDSISKGMIKGRKENVQLFNIMKKHFPGFKDARIRKISETIGIRETRRIVAKYTVTKDDALIGKHYKDCIATTTYNFDLPDPKRPSYDPMMGSGEKPNAIRKHEIIEIPYRSLLPNKVKNLIVVGRSISVEREVLGPIRIMGSCIFMGQAAGTASYLAKERKNYYDIDIKTLRNIMIKDGCMLP